MATRGGAGAVLPGIGLAAAAWLWTPIGPFWWRMAAFLACLVVVGLLAERLVRDRLTGDSCGDGLERLVLASGFGLVLALAIAGAVHLMPGPMAREGLAASIGGVTLVLVVLGRRKASPPLTFRRGTLPRVLAVLVLGAGLRLVALDYSELQGDEASVMLRASAMVQGVEEAPLAHRKGPGELLLAALGGQLVGRAAEVDARFPFAAIGAVSGVAFFALGRAMFGERAGLIAALLWAINGYAVAFGRIVQYHTLVLLLTALAALCAWRAYQAHAGSGAVTWGASALLFLGVALGCGFNALTLGVPAAYLLSRRLAAPVLRRPLSRGRTVLLVAGSAAAVAAASVPLLYLAPTWPDFLRYLATRVGRGQPFNNLDSFGGVTVLYASLPYFGLTMGIGIAVVCRILWGGAKAGPARPVLAVVLAVGIAALVVTGGRSTSLAVALWGVAVGGIAMARDVTDEWKAGALGVGVPFGLYAFLVERPQTHWYELFPALLLMVGAAVDRVLPARPNGLERLVLPIGGLGLLLLAAYPAGTFLPVWPDRLVPEAVMRVYRPDLGRPRSVARFGFPHRVGWKAVARLEDEGRLRLPYDSNAYTEITAWYLPSAERCERRPATYLLVTDSLGAPAGRAPGNRAATGAVQVDARETILMYTRPTARAAEASPPLVISAESAADWYDATRSTLVRPIEPTPVECRARATPAWREN